MKKVTVDMSAKRTIENGEVNIEAPCTCAPEQQILTSDELRCRHCRCPIPHSKDRIVELCDLVPSTFVSVTVEPHDTHSIITSRTIVSDCERIYELSGDFKSQTFMYDEKIRYDVAMRNFQDVKFECVFLNRRTFSSSGVRTCLPFLSKHGCLVDLVPGGGELVCVLKKPQRDGMSIEQFDHDNNTLLTLRFRAPHLAKVAFSMLLHKRLGNGSTWSLSKEHVKMICTFV